MEMHQSNVEHNVNVRGSKEFGTTLTTLEGMRETIRQLYIIENRKFQDVLKILDESYGVQLTKRQLKMKILQWGWTKYVLPKTENSESNRGFSRALSLATRELEARFQSREPSKLESNSPRVSTPSLFKYDTDGFPIHAKPNTEIALDNTVRLKEHAKSHGYEDSSSAIRSNILVETTSKEESMGPRQQSPDSAQGTSLGSTSTCSSPEPQTFESEKRRIVDVVMRDFLENLDTYLEEICETNEADDPADGGDRKDCESKDKGKGVSRGTGCRKRRKCVQHRDDGKDDGTDDADEDREASGSKRQKSDSNDDKSTRLACPYFKWNPHKYRHHRVCVSPGWKSVHRVKEHLYRCHEKPLYRCRRCHRDLKQEEALDVHQREDPPCDIVVLPEPCDKYGTEKASRLRKRSDGRKSEKDQWIEVYRILFDVRDDELPSPYCEDYSLAIQSESWPEHVRREARPLLRELLATEVARALTNIAPEILHNLRDLVRQLEPTLRQSYEQSQDENRDQDGSQTQPEEKEVDEEEDDEEEPSSALGHIYTIPIPQSSSDIPRGFTSISATHPTTDTPAHIPYTSVWTPDTRTSDPLNLVTGYHGADTLGQTSTPSMATWPAGASADNRLQSGFISGSTLANTGGLLARDQTRLAQSYGLQDATDLQEWNVIGRCLPSDDTSFDWDNWQADFGGESGASPGGGGPSGGT